jgi:hypothetical protein
MIPSQISKLIPDIFEDTQFDFGSKKSSLFSNNGFDVVEYFINQKYEMMNVEICERFRGYYCILIRNQNSSKIIQNLINKADHFSISKIFWEILPEVDKLIIDPCANYFCQKFYSYIQFEEKLSFLIQLRKTIILISNNSIGTYPLQSIIEKLVSNEEMVMISEVFRNELVFVQVCNNPYGVHVIEKIIACFPDELILFI